MGAKRSLRRFVGNGLFYYFERFEHELLSLLLILSEFRFLARRSRQAPKQLAVITVFVSEIRSIGQIRLLMRVLNTATFTS